MIHGAGGVIDLGRNAAPEPQCKDPDSPASDSNQPDSPAVWESKKRRKEKSQSIPQGRASPERENRQPLFSWLHRFAPKCDGFIIRVNLFPTLGQRDQIRQCGIFGQQQA